MSDQPSTVPASSIDVHHHRDIQGGAARAAVFGVSDGLVSNVGLILGVAGADTSANVVVVAGLAGLVAGAISMAAGEYNSMRVQAELLERELDIERREIARNPRIEAEELAQRYESRGVDADLARELAHSLIDDPDLALEFHARDELGIQPGETGSPFQAAAASLGTFSIGAVVPLLPWLFSEGGTALVATLILAFLAAVGIGLAIAAFTEVSRSKTILRQIVFTAVPAALTYAIGSLVGVGV